MRRGLLLIMSQVYKPPRTVEPPDPDTISPYSDLISMVLFFSIIAGVLFVCCVLMLRGTRGRPPPVAQQSRTEDSLRALDREGYSEPNTSMILCSFCKAKNESRAPKCWNCGAKM